MAHKHLHELLREDQEPFLLENYIAEKRCKLTRLETKTHLQLKKPKLISHSSAFTNNFCKNACLFSFHDSPDPSKSPLFRPSSPAISPCKTTNAIFLQIPARTAAMLLEAAMKIQKQSETKNAGVGLFGSILKRLTRTRTRKREIEGDGIRVSVKDILRWDSSVGRKNLESEAEIKSGEVKSASEKRFSWASKSRMSSVWSDSNEERSLDLETASISSCSEEAEEFVAKDCDDDEKRFCISPFRFALQKSPSGRRTPDFSSPATSPSRHKNEECYEAKGAEEFRVQEEEEKEQCSPVSVLDPPFEDDDDRHDDEDNEAEDDDGYNLECSYAIVQRAKHKLLNKLRRFERLADLDPIELEKRMLEEEDDDDEDADEGGFEDEEECEDDNESPQKSLGELPWVPPVLKRLVSDLVAEERVQLGFNAGEVVAKIVCKRLESWKEVELNTIDMMVESDFRKEVNGWTKHNEAQLQEMAMEIELAVLGLLVDELWDEGL